MIKIKSKKLLVVIAIGVIFFSFIFNATLVANANYNTSLTGARSMVLIEQNSKRVLVEKNANQKLAMASTTKIMTALVALDSKKDLDTPFVVSDEAVGIEGTSIYLRKGEKLTLKELLYGLMLPSGNDASVAIAAYVGDGSVQTFVNKMNAKAKKVGAVNTNFINPHGLDAKGHYTTAYDLALITAEALKHPLFEEICTTKNIQITSIPEVGNRFLRNKHKLLRSYEGFTSGKIGFTDNAGRCLVTSAKRDGMSLIAVVLNCPNMFLDSAKVLDYGFNNYSLVELLKPYNLITSVPVEEGQVGNVKVYSERGFYYPLKKEEKQNVVIENKLPSKLKAPIKKETEIGKVFIYLNKDLIFSEKVYNMEGVKSVSVDNTVKDIIERWFYD